MSDPVSGPVTNPWSTPQPTLGSDVTPMTGPPPSSQPLPPPGYQPVPTVPPPYTAEFLAERPVFGYARFQGRLEVPAPWTGAPIQAIDAGRRGESLVRPRWGIPDSVISQILTIVAPLVFIAVYYAITPNTPFYNITAVFLGLVVEWIFLGGWPLVVSYWRGNGPRYDYGFSLSWRDIGPGVLGAVACLFGAAFAGAITQAIFGNFSSNAGQVASDLGSHPIAQNVFIVLGVFGAPIIEELAFRGLLWGALAKRRFNPWWCTVISAAVFAGVHLEPVRFGVLFVAGFVLGFLRQKTGRLGPSLLAHMGLNAIAFLGAGFLLFR